MNVIRLNEPFEALGYVNFPFTDSSKNYYLGKISYHPVHGATIEVRFPHFQRGDFDFLYRNEEVVIGGVFNNNLFLFSSPCKVPNKTEVDQHHSFNASWMKSIWFQAEFLYLEDFDYQFYKDNEGKYPEEIYENAATPPDIYDCLICFNEVHRNSKLPSTYHNVFDLIDIVRKLDLNKESVHDDIRKASLNNIICELGDLKITIRNRHHTQANSFRHDGLCVNGTVKNGSLSISGIVEQADKFRYLFILLLRAPINVKYISLFKKDSNSQISFLHNFKEIDYQDGYATGFSLDELNNNDDLKSYIEAWLFHVDNYVFETYVKPTLFERYDRRYDLYSKIVLIYARVEAIYKKCSNAKAKLYDVILGVFCCMQNDGLYSKLISAKVPAEVVKTMLVEYRNNIAHEATINLSESYDYVHFYDMLFVIFEYYTLGVVLGMSKDRLHELYQYSVNFDLFFVKIKSCKQFFDV